MQTLHLYRHNISELFGIKQQEKIMEKTTKHRLYSNAAVLIITFFTVIAGINIELQAQNRLRFSQAAKIDKLFSGYNNSTPGAAISIVKNGSIVYKRGFGMSTLEYDIPIKTTSIFHIASISKQFTTMAIVLLEEQGKLSFEDDIRKYIPEVPDFGKIITIRHLANHVSGLRDQWELLGLAGWRRKDIKRQKGLNFEPGEEYLYCNTGFTLLAIIVNRVSGKSLRDFADENIFKPLDMHNTHFHNDMSEIVKNRTSAYVRGRGGIYRISIPNFETYGATSLFTTVEDLALWSNNFVHKQVGGESGLRKLLTKGILNDGKEIDYALGISHGTYRGLATIGHGGADAGYRSNFIMFSEHNLSIIIFANVSNANPALLSRKVADIILENKFTEEKPTASRPQRNTRPERPELNSEQLQEFTGSFYSEELDVVYVFYVKDNSLFLTNIKLGDNKLRIKATDKFTWGYHELSFIRNNSQEITGFNINSGRVRNLKFIKK